MLSFNLLIQRMTVHRCSISLLAILFAVIGCANGQIGKTEGVREINGTKLFVKVFGRGEPLLVVHGGPGLNHTYFLPHLESLSKNYTIILYDERACGRSAIPSTDSLGLKFLVDDIDAIRKELGYEKINILGHSWGAIPVVRYGIDYPDKVKTMILCNPLSLSHEFDAEIAAIQKRRMTSSDSTERAGIVGSQEFKSGNPAAYEEIMKLAFRHSFATLSNSSKLQLDLPENFLKANRALLTGLGKDLWQYDYYHAVSKFKFSVLILHGQHDALPLKISQRIQSSIPHSQLILFEKSGHFIFIEEPEKFREALTMVIRQR